MLRFFFKFIYALAFIAVHYPESACFLYGDFYHGYGAVCPLCLVVLEHEVIVHLVDMVSRKDKYVVRI